MIAGDTLLADELAEAARRGRLGRSPTRARPQELDAPFLILDLEPAARSPRPRCRARRRRSAARPARSPRSTRAVGASGSTRCRRSSSAAGRADARARQRRVGRWPPPSSSSPRSASTRLGRRRPGPRPGTDRLPGHQRGRVRARRGRRQRDGHRRRDGPRAQLSARDPRVGRRDRSRPRPARCSTRSTLERGEERYRAAPALRRLGWTGRLGTADGRGLPRLWPDMSGPWDACRHLPGAGRGRASTSAPSPSSQARDDAVVPIEATGDLRLRSPHLPRPGQDRAGLHDRPRVRRARWWRPATASTGWPSATACSAAFTPPAGRCFFCLRGDYHKCDQARTFGHGAVLGSLQGAQAEQVLVPNANLTLRRVPEGVSDDVALFAGDVMGTGYHAVAKPAVSAGRHRRRARARAGRPVRGAGRARRPAPAR